MLSRWSHWVGAGRLPSAVRDRLTDAAPLERPLAWAVDQRGRWYVGTAAAFYLPDVDDAAAFRRLPWEQILRADWSSDDDVLTIVEADENSLAIRLMRAARLLELVRERVTRSIVCSVSAAVRGDRSVTVAARRSPTGDGELVWTVAYSAGLDPDDPAVSVAVRRAREQALAEISYL